MRQARGTQVLTMSGVDRHGGKKSQTGLSIGVLVVSGALPAAMISALLAGYPVWAPELANVVTPFGLVPVVLALVPFVIGSVLYSLAILVIGLWKRSPLAPVPALILILGILVTWHVPVSTIFYRIEFELLYSSRSDVVRNIERENARSPADSCNGLGRLDRNRRFLSRGGGEIVCDVRDGHTHILFFTYRGILDNYDGFYYRSDDEEPTRCFGGETALTIAKMRDHWFWMSCT